MFMRRTFSDFLKLHSDAAPIAPVPNKTIDHVIDWRWLGGEDNDPHSPSECSLIEWPAWAKPKTPRRG